MQMIHMKLRDGGRRLNYGLQSHTIFTVYSSTGAILVLNKNENLCDVLKMSID